MTIQCQIDTDGDGEPDAEFRIPWRWALAVLALTCPIINFSTNFW